MQSARFRLDGYRSQPRAWLAGALVYILASILLVAVVPNAAVRTGGAAIFRILASFVLFTAAVLLANRVSNPNYPELRRLDWKLLWVSIVFWVAADLFLVLIESGYHGLIASSDIPRLLNLMAYFLAASGLTAFIPSRHRQLGRMRLMTEMFVSALAGMALAYLVLNPFLWDTKSPNNEVFWAAVFPLLDVGLLMMVSSIWMIADKPAARKTLCLFWLAFLAFTIKDGVSGYLELRDRFTLDSAATSAWIVGVFLLAWALQVELPGLHKPTPDSQPPTIFQSIQSLFPLALTTVLVWYAFITWQLSGQFNLFVIWMVILCLIGIILNQGILAGERELQEYASLVENADQPAFICNPDGRLQLVSPALVQSIGCSHQDMLYGMNLAQLLAPGQDPFSLLSEAFISSWSGETNLRRQDGSIFPVHLSLRRIASQSAAPGWRSLNFLRAPTTIAGVIHDLTAQKEQQAALQLAYEEADEAHRRLKQLNEQLEQKVTEKTQSLSEAYQQLETQNLALQRLDELKSDFVSMVSHELRAPLTNISAGIELVLTGPLPENETSSLELVQAEIRRLSHFVESILDLSALEAGRVPVYPSAVCLPNFFVSLRAQLGSLPRHDHLVWDIPDDLPIVMADDRVLASVFFHLLDNATKYAPEGDVEVSTWAEGSYVYITVSDHGSGIPEDKLALVFEKFFRLNNSDSQTVYGYGLGLYSVRRLLQAMKGDIRAENRPEGGACFIFWLPILEETHEQ